MTDDQRDNEVLVTGGVLVTLSERFRVDVVRDADGEPTNELYVWPDYMKSRYRVTITMDPE